MKKVMDILGTIFAASVAGVIAMACWMAFVSWAEWENERGRIRSNDVVLAEIKDAKTVDEMTRLMSLVQCNGFRQLDGESRAYYSIRPTFIGMEYSVEEAINFVAATCPTMRSTAKEDIARSRGFSPEELRRFSEGVRKAQVSEMSKRPRE